MDSLGIQYSIIVPLYKEELVIEETHKSSSPKVID